MGDGGGIVGLERLTALRLPMAQPAPLQPPPRLEWVPLNLLRIDRSYQRSLSDRSIRLIRRMVERFDWARMKALSVLERADGTFEVLDGQHTAIAAMTHGGLNALPCLICASRDTKGAAAAFVDLNRERVALTALQVFWAEVAAGDELATEVVTGVGKGGGRIPQKAITKSNMRHGDTSSIATLKALARHGGVAYVRRAVALGVKCRLRPITREFLIAFDALCWGQYAGRLSDRDIVDVVRTHGDAALVGEAYRLLGLHGGRLGDRLAQVIAGRA